uniref:BPI2 domain-containing protein n=1 Tax=Ascaris lumbricoides TaxID=6252 RepID=A0A0M3IPR8_ASCLU
ISTSGYVKASAVDIRTVLQADIDVDGKRPQLNIDACSMDLQSVDVIVGGGVLPWIVNLFRPELSRLVREEIRSQLCITLQTVLLEKVNEILHSLPTHIQIANNFFLNYRCEEKPLSTNSFIEGEMYSDIVYDNTTCDLPIRYMDHEGEMYSDIVYDNITCDLPIRYMDHEVGHEEYMAHFWISEHIPNCLLLSAHSGNLLNFVVDKNFNKGKFKSFLSTRLAIAAFFFEVGHEEYMAHFWISDHIPNCLLLSAHSANLLNFVVDKNFNKGKFKSFLSTSCSFISLCIGRFFPILHEYYPNEFVDLRFHTADTPDITILPSGISTNLLLDVDLFISPWTEHKDVLARLAANVTFDILPSIVNKSLSGTITNVTVVIVEVKSTIGHFNQRFIAVLETLTRDAIEVLAISALRIGIHLPLVDNVTLADDARIVSRQGFLRIDSDFVYQWNDVS